MALLEVRDLQKKYGRRQVVCGVDFDVDPGEVVGLLGPNGAGKTTSFRMTIGLISTDGGQVTFGGTDITQYPMYRRARAGMGYLPQDTSVFRQLTVQDNLMAILETRTELTRRERIARQDQLLDQFGLSHIRKTKAQFISGGEKRRLEIARCLITEPSLIMLDEPFAGIDPKTVGEIQISIRRLADEFNIGILLTDHEFRETLAVTDRNYLISAGKVIFHGNRDEFLRNAEVRTHYLGERADLTQLMDRSSPPEAGPPPAPLPRPTPAVPPAAQAHPAQRNPSQPHTPPKKPDVIIDAYTQVVVDASGQIRTDGPPRPPQDHR